MEYRNGGFCRCWCRDRVNDSIRLYNRLRYPMHDGYVNAGVLLINLKKWREFHVFDRAKEVAKAMPKALKIMIRILLIFSSMITNRYFLSAIIFLNIICMWKNGCILTESIIRRLLMLVKIRLLFISVCRKNLGIMNVLILLRNCTINTAR